jgi:hypothetical protein
MKIGGLGFGMPLAYFESRGLIVEDVTLDVGPTQSPASDFIEPFMDPFAASFLHRLAIGALDDFAAILVLRESPGAIFALHYGKELARKGVLPATAPELVVVNLIGATRPDVAVFNTNELRRVRTALGLAETPTLAGTTVSQSERLETLKNTQEQGSISGADAFESRRNVANFATGDAPKAPPAAKPKDRRFALLGTPLGNSGLHALIDTCGSLLFDQQGWDQTISARADTAEAVFSAMAENPFAARQPRDIFVPSLLSEFKRLNITEVVWQVDPHDDLWGWLMPSVREGVEQAGKIFHDLGFLPRWPNDDDLIRIAERLKI